MSRRVDGRPGVMGPQPAETRDSRNTTLEPGDPLVRALIVCVRQAHTRRRAGRALD